MVFHHRLISAGERAIDEAVPGPIAKAGQDGCGGARGQQPSPGARRQRQGARQTGQQPVSQHCQRQGREGDCQRHPAVIFGVPGRSDSQSGKQ